MHVVFGSILATAEHVRLDERIGRQSARLLCILKKPFHWKEVSIQRQILPKLFLNQQGIAQQQRAAVVKSPINSTLRQQVINRVASIEQMTDVPGIRTGLPQVSHVAARRGRMDK